MISLSSLFQSFWITLGIWMNIKLLHMVIIQAKYGGNSGELYLKGQWRYRK
jgi:hypothetical protein